MRALGVLVALGMLSLPACQPKGEASPPVAASAASAPAEVATLATPARPGGFALSKTGRVAAAECGDKKLRLWSLPDGRMTREIDVGGRDIDTIVLSADGGRLAAGDHAGVLTIWDTSTGTPHASVQVGFEPHAIAFSRDSGRIAIAPADDPVLVYDASTGVKQLELPRPLGGTMALAFSRDGALIAAADGDTVVRIYDAQSGALVWQNTDFLLDGPTADFSADGKKALAGGADKVIATLDVATGRAVRFPKGVDPVVGLEVSAEGAFVAVARIHADDMREKALIAIAETSSRRMVQEWTPIGHLVGSGWVDGGLLLVVTASENALHVWRVR